MNRGLAQVVILALCYLFLQQWFAMGSDAGTDSESVTQPGDGGVPGSVHALWKIMRDADMITDEQYRHVLGSGSMPAGSVVRDSPVAKETQSRWFELEANEVMTAAELAHLLFAGTLPVMTDAETKAFAELAAVYEPDPRKWLTYDARIKHGMVAGIRFAKERETEHRQAHEEALDRAGREGFPTEGRTPNGGWFKLLRFERGMPVYIGSCNATAAKTISTDRVHPGSAGPISGLTGTNVLIGLLDAGPVHAEHREFGDGRVSNVVSGASSDHATAVAGTLIAAAPGSRRRRAGWPARE